jgi:hypothetical protein
VKYSIRILKATLNRIWAVALLIVALYLLFSLLFALIEGYSFGEGLWWGVVTWSTTGYGDFYPVTIPGRVLSGTYMVVNTLLMLFAAAHIVGAVIEDKNLFSHDEQERIEGAVYLIGRATNAFPRVTDQLPTMEELKEWGFRAEDPIDHTHQDE